MALSEYDDNLKFELPYGYMLLREENDDGEEVCNIVGDEYENDDGETDYNFRANFIDVNVESTDGSEITEDKALDGISDNDMWDRVYKHPGELQVLFTVKKTPLSVFGAVMKFFSVMAMVVTAETKVTGIVVVTNQNDDEPESLIKTYQQILDVVGAIRVDGKRPDTASLSAESLAETLTPDFEEDEEAIDVSPKIQVNLQNGDEVTTFEIGNDDEPVTTKLTTVDPDESLYPHYNTFVSGSVGILSLLGAQVNTTGTEYQFNPLSEIVENDEAPDDYKETISRIIEKDKESFSLADEADKMQSVFHVNPSVFNCRHDKEAELQNGLMHRAYMMSGLRSFAWTLADYCKTKNVTPSDIDYTIADWIADFVADRNYLNYDGDTYCKGLCSGSDLHVYFVPDGVTKADKKKLLPSDEDLERIKDMKKKFPNYKEILSEVHSLNELRKDLEYVYPAVKVLYEKLKEERDTSVALEGNDADIVYAWIALAKAARTPFFSEDGPMGYWYSQEETDEEKEEREEKERAKWEAERERQAIEDEKEWLKNYGKYVEKNPVIDIPGKIFVFSGLSGHQFEKEDPLVKKVVELGGLYRQSVSGKTDYLIVDPKYAGRSKIVGILEQRQKGKTNKVILEEDLRNYIDGNGAKSARPVSALSSSQTESTNTVKSSSAAKKPKTSSKSAQNKSGEDLGELTSTLSSLNSQLKEAESQQISSEDAEKLKEIQSSLSKMSEQFSEAQDGMEKYGDYLEQKEAREKKAEEEKARKKAEALAKGKSESDIVNMYIILTNEKKLGKIRRAQNKFYEIYEEDFPALSKTEVINTRKDMLTEMSDESLCSYYAESFKQRSVKERFEVSTLNLRNVSDEPDITKSVEFAIENSKEWFKPEEYAEVKRLMDSELKDMRKQLDDQLKPIDENWTKYSTGKQFLQIVIEEKASDDSDLKKNGTCFQVAIDGALISVEIASKGIFRMSTVVMDCFPWYWGVTIRDIWEAASKNELSDERTSTYDGKTLASKALNQIRAKYPETKVTTAASASTASSNSGYSAPKPSSYSSANTDNAYRTSTGSSANTGNAYRTSTNASTSSTQKTSNQQNNQPKKSGCYVATAVYGSYDCPQVWTLRRFRDYSLAFTWYGRLFITLYYAISPAIVKWFGETEWFNKMWRGTLDRMVEKLNEDGYEDTPYNDRQWK